MNYIGQLQYNVNIGNKKIGNFELLDENNEAKNLLEFMKKESNFPDEQSGYISKLGIQAPPGTQWKFKEENNENENPKSFYIGETGIYELDNVKLFGLFYVPQSDTQADPTAQYIAYDNSIKALENAESSRQKAIEDTEINEDSVQKYINAQKEFYINFLSANQYYDKAFKGLYWNAGILNPENIIIDYYLELEDNQ